jgi:Ni,Fe-hydrogenase III component G
MFYVGYLKYVLQSIPYLVLKNNSMAAMTSVSVVIPAAGMHYLALFFKYSYFFKKMFLVDLGGYDIPRLGGGSVGYAPVLWYLFKNSSGFRYFVFALPAPRGTGMRTAGVFTIDTLFRNARWLEREASEFFGFFFANKADRRVLFTIPLFYNAPFRRKYPAVGMYEIFFCPLLRKLKFKHLSLQI